MHAEELQDTIGLYESKGYFQELISLLEAGLGLERAHMGIFSELAICYAKYQPSRCMEHLKVFSSRINIRELATFDPLEFQLTSDSEGLEKCRTGSPVA